MRIGNVQYTSSIYGNGLKSNVEKLDKEIDEQLHSEKPDIHRVYRLEEEKLIQGMFNQALLGGSYARYRSPW